MSKKVCIQAGHLNVKSNCDISLRGSTGAGGEVEINQAVTKRLSELLTARGIEVKLVDANYNCDPESVKTDYNLFLSCHCDMNYANDSGSGFCDFPDPSTDDATAESQRMAKVIQDTFFPAVGITIKSRSNANTRYYYMWKYISALTPCVLIEMGQVQDAHDYPILKDTEKTAKALASAVLKALGIDEIECDCVELQKELEDMRASRNSWREKYGELDESSTKEIKAKIEHIEQLQKTIAELNNKISMDNNATENYRKDILVLKKEIEENEMDLKSLSVSLEESNKENERLLKKLKEVSNMNYDPKKAAFLRFLRTALPQVPAVVAYLTTQKPEWAALLALVGAIVTALDKYLRDSGVYGEK